MDLGLDGKRAIVTGGSRGIGLAIARGLAAEGVDMVIAARNAEALESAARSVAQDPAARSWESRPIPATMPQCRRS